MITPWRWASRRLDLLLALLACPVSLVVCLGFHEDRPLVRWEETHRAASHPSWGELSTTFAFSPDGRMILTNHAKARLRDVATGRVIADLAEAPDDVTPSARVALHYPTFFDGGRLLVAEIGGSLLDPEWSRPTLKVWDVATGVERASFPDLGHSSPGPKFVVSADGKTLAFSQGPPPQPPRWVDKRLRAWTPSLGLNPHEFIGAHHSPFALSPDGRNLFVIELDGPSTITRWDVASGCRLGIVPHDPACRPSEMIVAPDGRLLVWYNPRCQAELIELDTGRSQPLSRNYTGFERSIRFGGGGKLLLIGDLRKYHENLQIGDLDSGRLIDVSRSGFDSISADGRRLAAIERKLPESRENRDGDAVIVTDVPSESERVRFDASGVDRTWLSPDGRRIAIRESLRERSIWNRMCRQFPLAGRWFGLPASEFTMIDQVTVMDVDARRRVATIPLPEYLEFEDVSLVFSPDRTKVLVEYPISERGASRSMEWAVEIWDLPDRPPWWSAVGISAASTLGAFLLGQRLGT